MSRAVCRVGAGFVASRPQFRPYVAAYEVRAYVVVLSRLSLVEPDPELTPGLTPDPGDDYLVAFARAAGAHFVISSDPHLTELKQARPPVLTPRAFLPGLECLRIGAYIKHRHK